MTIATACLSVCASAYDFSREYNGAEIYYNIVEWDTPAVEVTYGGEKGQGTDSYASRLYIPDSVEYNEVVYTVVGIGEYAFAECATLEYVIFGNNGDLAYISDYAFSGCTSLSWLSFFGFEPPSTGADILSGCYDFVGINVLFGAYNAFASADVWSDVYIFEEYYTFFVDGIYYALVGDDEVYVSSYAYRSYEIDYECPYSGDVVIPDDVAFKGKTYKVTGIIDYAFADGEDITSVQFGANIEMIGMLAFRNCTSLTAIDIPESLTTIDEGAFAGCSSLVEMELPDGMDKVPESIFTGCTSLRKVTLPESVKSFELMCFAFCTSLEDINIPQSLEEIDQQAFCYCMSLEEITIPESVTYMSDQVFVACVSLKRATINGKIPHIGDQAFQACSSLEEVTIPETVTEIWDEAFLGCENLASITCLNPEPPELWDDVFEEVDTDECVLYVPAGAKEAYASADGWEEFLNIREMDTDPVNSIVADGEKEISSCYTLDGRQTSATQRGVNIIRRSDGTVSKVLVN